MSATSPDPTLEGGVMPVERAGSSPGARGKAIPVDQTAWQLCLPVATAEDPRGSARVVASSRPPVDNVERAIVEVCEENPSLLHLNRSNCHTNQQPACTEKGTPSIWATGLVGDISGFVSTLVLDVVICCRVAARSVGV